MTCEQAADRIVERLYGELAEEERPLLEGHLAACERCRLEVEGLDRTRRTARLLLEGPLLEPAPARVRRDVLQAAELAVRQRAAAPAGPGPAASEAVRGLWYWLRRPWFLPAFAAASLLAIFFIARPVLIDGPSRLLDRPSPSIVSFSTEAEPVPENLAPPLLDEAADQAQPLRRSDPRQPEAANRLSAPAEPAAAPQRRRSASPTRAKRAQPVLAEAPAPARAESKGFAEADSTGYAPPPAANALHQAGPEGQRARPTPVGLGRDLALRLSDTPGKSASPPSGIRLAQPAITRTARAGAAPAPPPTAAPAAAAAPAAEAASAPVEPLATLMEKADRFFNERRWQEAADAYRDLLRRSANHPRAAEWQRRRAIAVASLRP